MKSLELEDIAVCFNIRPVHALLQSSSDERKMLEEMVNGSCRETMEGESCRARRS